MKMFHVGSGIHGELLSPVDIDICLEVESLVNFIAITRLLKSVTIIDIEMDVKSVAVSRHGDLNIIILLGMTVKEYTNGFDVNLVRGFRDLQTNKLVLSAQARKGLNTKTLEFLNRNPMHESVCKLSGMDNDSEHISNKSRHLARVKKYVEKLPDGFKLIVNPVRVKKS